jgi:alkanesulfonate monooxygenase SsuD/methylene tetrahydromethanopterin reductase-like flavin-dependent oxidoreductase (luciferase family)
MISSHPIFGRNRLNLGVFCANTMPALTTAPDLFRPSWHESLTVAKMADDAGFEALVPIARWKGYVDDAFEHPSNEVLEPFTYAAAMAQATRQIAVFATTHAPTVHPLIVAKQAATIDVISGGRFAMNVVGGWNRREFDMFGIELLGHEERYVYLTEWLGIIRRLWSSDVEIDVSNKYFRMSRALSLPHPVQGADVPIMNAGFSATGMRFAAANSDIGLIGLFGQDEQAWSEQIARYKRLARDEFGKTIQVWTNAPVVLRDTDKEAEDRRRYYSEETADQVAIDSFIATLARENKVPEDSEQMRFMRRTVVLGTGTPLIGSAETIARTLESLSRAGLDGGIMSYVDFVDGLHRFQRDVLPRLEAAGLRAARPDA